MKAAFIVLGVILTIIIGLGSIVVLNYIHYHDYANQLEQTITTQKLNNKNVLGQYSLKVKEAAQVGDRYTDKLTELMTKSLSSRYGDEGVQAEILLLSENHINMDPQIYIKLQQIIQAGRDEFQLNQTVLLDKCDIYKKELGNLWSKFFMTLAGFPKIDIGKDCNPITSEYANDAFETGIEKGLNVFNK